MTRSRGVGEASRLTALVLLLRTGWRAGPGLALASLALTTVIAVSHLVTLYGMKLVVDAVGGGSRRDGLIAVLVVALAVAGRQAASWTDNSVGTALRERIAMTLEARVVDLTAGVPGLEHHERPELIDQLQQLRERRWMLGDVVSATITNLSVIIQVVSTMVLLSRVHLVLLLVPLAGVGPLLASARRDQITGRVDNASAERLRLTYKLLDLSLDPRAAGELRLHRADTLILRRHREAHESLLADREAVLLRARLLEIAGDLLFTAARLAAVAFVATRAAAGSFSPGDALLAFGLLSRVGNEIGDISNGLDWLLACLRTVARLSWLEDEVDRSLASSKAMAPHPAPARLVDGIRLEGVEFAYPGTERSVLAGVDLHLPAGTTVALVGDNGAGKSTLVKLLCRFYEPTAGRITVDGVDLRAIPVEEWRRRISGAFQEPAPIELVAREVVGLGDVARLADDAAITAAVERAGASAVVDSLPAGLDTPLGPSFDRGVELSGGQWQQLALARAMMRDDPLLLLLDEPTAALDPASEHQLFERYAAGARAAASSTGGITLLVSHRFSTVRMADLIVVVDGGRIAEVGSHADLVAKGGLYAELYGLQEKAYGQG